MSKNKKNKNIVFNNVMSAVVDEQEKTQFIEKTESETIVYDDVENPKDELIKMSNENSDLTDKLAEYIEEIKNLKEKIKTLTEENDKHLMKIAELSFENATLRSSQTQTNLNTVQTKPSNFVHYPIHNVTHINNGYSSWN